MNVTTHVPHVSRSLNITHHILSGLLILDVLMAGIAFLASTMTSLPQITDTFVRLSYPLYLLPVLGFFKLTAVAALLKGGALREWAHVGLFFMFLLAFYSHVSAGNGLAGSFPALLAFILNIAAYFVFKKLSGTRPGV